MRQGRPCKPLVTCYPNSLPSNHHHEDAAMIRRILICSITITLMAALAGTLISGQPAGQKAPSARSSAAGRTPPSRSTAKAPIPPGRTPRSSTTSISPGSATRPGRQDQDEGETALGSRISLLLRRHGGHRSLRRRQGAQRPTWNNDVFELFFKPADDKPGYYEFQVNAAGTVLDCFFPRRNAGGFERFKNETKFHVDAKVEPARHAQQLDRQGRGLVGRGEDSVDRFPQDRRPARARREVEVRPVPLRLFRRFRGTGDCRRAPPRRSRAFTSSRITPR